MANLSVQTFPTDSEWEWQIECPFDPPHVHTYPSDWQFGGARNEDPRADPRFKPDSYYYWSDRMELIHVTSAYICDDEAIDAFTNVANFGPGYRPKFIQVRRNGERTTSTIPVWYDCDTDEVYDQE